MAVARLGRGAIVLLALAGVTAVSSQPATDPPADTGSLVATGLINWVHTTGDAERSFPFYRDVFEIQLARSPFAATAAVAAPPAGIRPVEEAGSDPLVWDLTNTHGARFRTVFMRASNTPFGLELSEFFDIPRDARPANAWDPGSSKLIFAVRDLQSVVARIEASGAPVVTVGGKPLAALGGASLLVRDPDGYLIEVSQASVAEIAAAESTGEVIRTAIGITVADLPTALRFYRELLHLDIGPTRRATAAELAVNGVTAGALTQTVATIPGTGTPIVISAYELPAGAPPPQPFRWRIQDVGAPQFQLQVTGLDALLERTKRAGYSFLSVDAKPIQRPFGRFVFAIDPDGVLVEFVEPAARQ